MDEHQFKRAMENPKAVFGSPEAVVHAKLAADQRRQLLERWQKDLPEANEPDLLTRIGRALAYLDTETGRHKDIESSGIYGAIDDNDPACRRD
jgi:hypothetical protein